MKREKEGNFQLSVVFSDRDKILDNSDVVMQFQVIIDHIESLIQENKINADVDKIYGLIERISSKRPVSF